jgi:hypothetical protein
VVIVPPPIFPPGNPAFPPGIAYAGMIRQASMIITAGTVRTVRNFFTIFTSGLLYAGRSDTYSMFYIMLYKIYQ